MHFCVCTWIMHVTLWAVGLQWHKMNRKCPDHPSSSLLTTAAERNKVSTGCYFFTSFSLFTPSYECICDRFDWRQCWHSCVGIFKWNFDHFFWETVSDVKKSVLTCGSRTRLTCRILIDLCSTDTVQVEGICIGTRNCVKCEGIFINVWLPCMVNVQDSARYTKNMTYSNKYFFTNCPKCTILMDLLYLAGFSQISSQMLWVLEQGTVN